MKKNIGGESLSKTLISAPNPKKKKVVQKWSERAGHENPFSHVHVRVLGRDLYLFTNEESYYKRINKLFQSRR